ncbi:MAG: reverse transcriptase domain-containing protein [Isosphaeraceae bacterium]
MVSGDGRATSAVLSPLLSNIYLDPLDHLVARAGFEMVRYADDFVILCRTPEEASRALELVRGWVAENGLTLHPTKTRVVDAVTVGFDFLGYHFEGGTRWPREKSLAKLKETIRTKTRRTNGDSLATIITSLNRTLRGWFEYFKHSRRRTFGRPRRDRSPPAARHSDLAAGRRRHGDGLANMRWPNAFFTDLGLFSLARAHALARQPSLR